MSTHRYIPAATFREVPWANGLGMTREIATDPEGGWRVSLAPMARDAAFSVFPGLDRVLTVVEGRGLRLSISGSAEIDPGAAPFGFPGDAPCAGRLTAGPVANLNVMVRRGAWSAAVAWREGAAPAAAADLRLVIAAAGSVAVDSAPLAPFDALWAAPARALSLSGRALDILLTRDPGDPAP